MSLKQGVASMLKKIWYSAGNINCNRQVTISVGGIPACSTCGIKAAVVTYGRGTIRQILLRAKAC